MNATPPEANIEYSRGPELPRRIGSGTSGGGRAGPAPARRIIAGAILAAALLGAALLLVAEFTTLFVIRTSAAAGPVRSVGTGSHHTYALVPIAILAVVLAFAVWAAGSRAALVAIGLLGVIALLIALLGDLPDAQASGLIGTSAGHYLSAASTPSTGLYLETLGAVLLVITSVSGFLLIEVPPRHQRRLSAS